MQKNVIFEKAGLYKIEREELYDNRIQFTGSIVNKEYDYPVIIISNSVDKDVFTIGSCLSLSGINPPLSIDDALIVSQCIFKTIRLVRNFQRGNKKKEFIIGDKVFFKKGLYPKNEGYISTITEVIYKDEYELIVKRFKKLSSWLLPYFSQEECNTIQPNDILEVRVYKPYFKLESGHIEKNPELYFNLVVESPKEDGTKVFSY